MQILRNMYTAKHFWIALLTVAAMLLVVVAAPAGIVEAGTSKEEACKALGAGANCSSNVGSSSVESAVKGAINILSILVGVIAVIMLIVGGFRYVTSGGDANATKGARDTILYALVGLVVVAIAQAIVQFVLERV